MALPSSSVKGEFVYILVISDVSLTILKEPRAPLILKYGTFLMSIGFKGTYCKIVSILYLCI